MSTALGPSGLLGVRAFHVPLAAAEEALDHLRTCGDYGFEGVALWAGLLEGDQFLVRETIVPEQEGHRTAQGLYYVVGGAELRRINRHLYDAGLLLGAQLHSHPGEAYHSETDDAYPVVAVLGGLSIVVPDFAVGPLDLASWAVYRLLACTGWTRVEPSQVPVLVQIA